MSQTIKIIDQGDPCEVKELDPIIAYLNAEVRSTVLPAGKDDLENAIELLTLGDFRRAAECLRELDIDLLVETN